MEELKPCPFCGGKARVSMCTWNFKKKEPGNKIKYIVECKECLAQTNNSYNKQEKAVKVWNARKEIEE